MLPPLLLVHELHFELQKLSKSLWYLTRWKSERSVVSLQDY